MYEYVVLVAHRGLRVGQRIRTDTKQSLPYLKVVKHDEPDMGSGPAVGGGLDDSPGPRVARRRKKKAEVTDVEDRAEQGPGASDSPEQGVFGDAPDGAADTDRGEASGTEG